MRTGDFSEPRRMSGSAYWVLFAKGLKEYASLFVILIVLKFIDADDQHTFMEKMRVVSLLSVGCLALAALTAFISWYFKKYYIEGGKLIFIHGLLSNGPSRGSSTGSWRCGVSCSIRLRPSRRR